MCIIRVKKSYIYFFTILWYLSPQKYKLVNASQQETNSLNGELLVLTKIWLYLNCDLGDFISQILFMSYFEFARHEFTTVSKYESRRTEVLSNAYMEKSVSEEISSLAVSGQLSLKTWCIHTIKRLYNVYQRLITNIGIIFKNTFSVIIEVSHVLISKPFSALSSKRLWIYRSDLRLTQLPLINFCYCFFRNCQHVIDLSCTIN